MLSLVDIMSKFKDAAKNPYITKDGFDSTKTIKFDSDYTIGAAAGDDLKTLSDLEAMSQTKERDNLIKLSKLYDLDLPEKRNGNKLVDSVKTIISTEMTMTKEFQIFTGQPNRSNITTSYGYILPASRTQELNDIETDHGSAMFNMYFFFQSIDREDDLIDVINYFDRKYYNSIQNRIILNFDNNYYPYMRVYSSSFNNYAVPLQTGGASQNIEGSIMLLFSRSDE